MLPKEDVPPAAASARAAAAAPAAPAAAAAEAGGEGEKRVLAIDIDEVLGQFVLQLCRFHNESYGTSLAPEDFSSYYFHEVWGGSRSTANDKMRDFFQSRHFLEGIPVVHGALEVLRKHAANFELHIVTSRQDILQAHTRKWITDNYPDVFADLHFGNHFSEEGVQRSKPELCRSIGAALIIDDNMRYATQCAEAGIPAYLFGERKRENTSNSGNQKPDGIFIPRAFCFVMGRLELASPLFGARSSNSVLPILGTSIHVPLVLCTLIVCCVWLPVVVDRAGGRWYGYSSRKEEGEGRCLRHVKKQIQNISEHTS